MFQLAVLPYLDGNFQTAAIARKPRFPYRHNLRSGRFLDSRNAAAFCTTPRMLKCSRACIEPSSRPPCSRVIPAIPASSSLKLLPRQDAHPTSIYPARLWIMIVSHCRLYLGRLHVRNRPLVPMSRPALRRRTPQRRFLCPHPLVLTNVTSPRSDHYFTHGQSMDSWAHLGQLFQIANIRILKIAFALVGLVA